MARLIVDKVICLQGTSELGSEDLYMIVFRGNTTAPFDSNIGVYGPGHFWEDFDEGDIRDGMEIPVAKYRPDAVYVAMLVEKDNNRDISGPEVIGAYKSQTGLVWKSKMFALLGGNPGPASESQRAQAASAISDTLLGLSSLYMEFPKGNDDVLGKPQRIHLNPGQEGSYNFINEDGDPGWYMVNFKVA